MKKRILIAGILLCSGFVASAQTPAKDSTQVQKLDEVVVSDSRFALDREESGKAVVRIGPEELARYEGRSVAEILNVRAGIEIVGSRGQAGQNLSSFIRGGNNRQVLVMSTVSRSPTHPMLTPNTTFETYRPP